MKSDPVSDGQNRSLPPMKSLALLSTLSLLFFFSSCDHGLEPPPAVKPGFGGRVAYKGTWPPADSVKLLALVAFKRFPPPDLVGEVLRGEAVFDSTLRKNVEFQDYKIFTDPGTFAFIIVAQQYGPNIFSDWRIIGVYSDDPNTFQPRSVTVVPDDFMSNVNITVDFDHLPPQVFGKKSLP